MLNTTTIPSSRVPFLDGRTGEVARPWYLFLENLFYLTGSGGNDTTLMEVQYPPSPNTAEFFGAQPVTPPDVAPISVEVPQAPFELNQNPFELAPILDPSIGLSVEDLQSLLAATEAAALAPLTPSGGLAEVITDTTLTGMGTLVSPLGVALNAPVTITADYTILPTDKWVINNKASACVLTFPSAATWPGRVITVQNYQAFTAVSVSSNIVPQGGGAAGTAILLGVVGNWATLVSDGTDWVIMQAAAFNNLLLE